MKYVLLIFVVNNSSPVLVTVTEYSSKKECLKYAKPLNKNTERYKSFCMELIK